MFGCEIHTHAGDREVEVQLEQYLHAPFQCQFHAGDCQRNACVRYVSCCAQKDPKQRWQCAGDTSRPPCVSEFDVLCLAVHSIFAPFIRKATKSFIFQNSLNMVIVAFEFLTWRGLSFRRASSWSSLSLTTSHWQGELRFWR
jgi:hypothetical protein